MNGLTLVGISISNETKSSKDSNIIYLKENEFNEFYNKNHNLYIMNDEINLLKQFYNVRLHTIPVYVTNFAGYQFLFSRYTEWLTCGGFHERMRKSFIKYMPKVFFNLYYKRYLQVLSNSNVYALSVYQALNINRIGNIRMSGTIYPPIDTTLFKSKPKKKNYIVVYLGNCTDTNTFDLTNILSRIKDKIKDYELISLGNRNLSTKISASTGIEVTHFPYLERVELYKFLSEAFFFINPIFNGDFEITPIESLLSETPVVSYILPFMEVTGQSKLIANIENYDEVESKIKMWMDMDISEEFCILKEKISKAMDCKIIAKKIYCSLKLSYKNPV